MIVSNIAYIFALKHEDKKHVDLSLNFINPKFNPIHTNYHLAQAWTILISSYLKSLIAQNLLRV